MEPQKATVTCTMLWAGMMPAGLLMTKKSPVFCTPQLAMLATGKGVRNLFVAEHPLESYGLTRKLYATVTGDAFSNVSDLATACSPTLLLAIREQEWHNLCHLSFGY